MSDERQKILGRNTIALGAAYVLVMALPNVLPIFVVAVMKDLALSEEGAGMLLTAELLALALTPALLAPLAPRLPLRAVLLGGASLALLGHVMAIVAQSLETLLATRLLAGFGIGLVFLAINRAASMVPDPVRLYGIMNSAGILTAFVLFLVAPYIIVPYGLVGAYGMLAALTVLAFPFMTLLHWPRIDVIQPTTMPAPNVSGRQRLLLSSGVLVVSCTYMSAYSFSEPLAANAGLSAAEIPLLLAVVQLFTLAATLASSWIGLRFGIMKPLSVMLILCAVFGAVMINTMRVPVFVGTYIVMNFCFLFTLAYQLGIGAVLDSSGRLAALGGGILFLGAALAPFVGGFLITRFGYASIALALCGAVAMGLTAFQALLRRAPAVADS